MPAARKETWARLPLSPAFCLFLGPNNQDPSIRSFSQPCPGIQKKGSKDWRRGNGKGNEKNPPSTFISSQAHDRTSNIWQRWGIIRSKLAHCPIAEQSKHRYVMVTMPTFFISMQFLGYRTDVMHHTVSLVEKKKQQDEGAIPDLEGLR